MPSGPSEGRGALDTGRRWTLRLATLLAVPCAAASIAVTSTASYADSVLTEHRPLRAATVLYVDGDAHAGDPPDQCPGDGSDASPFRSIDCAFASGTIRAGTTLQLRDSEIPYAGADSAAHALPSGTEANPIVIEPAPGHAPILTGPLTLAGLRYWTLRDLVFDGSGGGTPSTEAIRITSDGIDTTLGVRIEGTTIRQWPDRGIVLRGTSSTPLTGAVVQGNRIEGARDTGLWLENVASSTIALNEVSELDCVAYSPFTLCDECGPENCALCGDCLGVPLGDCGATSEHEIGGQSGVRVLGNSFDIELINNHFHDFLDDACGVERTRTAAVFITGAGARDSRIAHNLIERIAPGNPDNGYGILMYQSAPGWLVERNVLTEIGHCALCEGDWLFYGSRQTQWLHNTVVGVTGSAIEIRWAAEAQLRGNLVADAPDAPVRVWAEGVAEAPMFDNNLYWGGDLVVGRWGDDTPLSFLEWQIVCMCDPSSAWGDPFLPATPPFDPTPAEVSLAIDLVPALDARPFHGAAHDAGALEAPLALQARIRNDSPDLVRLTLQNEFAPPLTGFEGCVGFSVETSGVSLPLDSCAVVGDELQLRLVEPASGGTLLFLTYAGGSVSDSAAIGGLLGARLRPMSLIVDNDAPLPSVDDTAGEASNSNGTTSTDPDGGSDGGLSGDDEGGGCFCRGDGSAPRSAPSPLAWLLPLLARRRRTSHAATDRAGC
ncbi:MAG: right-handed parallel beta-helix repeat-containing protein [Myxococcota bacterium]